MDFDRYRAAIAKATWEAIGEEDESFTFAARFGLIQKEDKA
jgi:hypothetical protein